MNTADKVINNLGIQLANKTISEAFTLTERDEALADFKNIKASFEKINEILQSDKRLKNLYEEVKDKQIGKG